MDEQLQYNSDNKSLQGNAASLLCKREGCQVTVIWNAERSSAPPSPQPRGLGGGPSFYGDNRGLMEPLSFTGLTTTSTCCWEQFRATQASADRRLTPTVSSHYFLHFPRCLFGSSTFFLKRNQNWRQERPLTCDYSRGTAAVYVETTLPLHSFEAVLVAFYEVLSISL